MRRSVSTLATITLIAASIAAGSPGVGAQEPSCAGTWLLRVSPLGQPETAGRPVIAKFLADGGFVGSGAPVAPGPPDAPDNVTVSSGGLGVWEPTDTGCALTQQVFNSDLHGNLVSTVEIRIVFEIGPDGNSMSSPDPDFVTVMAPDGTALFSGAANTVAGTRMVVKLPPSPSPSPAASATP